ncbi:hypothetical protein [Streptomyces gilvifuscus]|uniref:Uncharacterized protein n=1 Tax=Streptomyces gilvifuscus TaxID=1550617 RepID=A0ABT5FKF3_9ACTN|nr:hypothetical protein [Streptomyces gilvifuscus]MDC2952993.1 hypothetical protein [Streptomyces gilvifuscus]
MSPLDQLVQLIGELPRQQRHAFEDAVLNKVRTEGKWRRAYDRDLEKGRDSFLVRVANNAYRREVAPADRQDAARRSEAAVREQLPAYTASPSTAPTGPREAAVESRSRELWDATVAQTHLASERSRAEAGSTTSALPERLQEAMPTAEEFLAAPDETRVQSAQSEADRSSEPARDSRERHLDPASVSPAPPPVSPLLSPVTPLTPAQLGAQYFGSEESLRVGGATVPAPATATPPDNPLGAQATLQRPPTPSSNQRPAPTQTPLRSVPAAGNAARPATRRRG